MKSKNNTYSPTDVFDQFIQEVFGKSPLEEAFQEWNETTKKIKEEQDEK